MSLRAVGGTGEGAVFVCTVSVREGASLMSGVVTEGDEGIGVSGGGCMKEDMTASSVPLAGAGEGTGVADAGCGVGEAACAAVGVGV